MSVKQKVVWVTKSYLEEAYACGYGNNKKEVMRNGEWSTPCVGDTGNHVTYGKCPIDREVQKTKKPGWQNGKKGK